MMIEVRLFARARDLAGRDLLPVEVPQGSTVAELRVTIAKMCPVLKDLLARSRIAVGDDFGDDEARLTPGALVAVIPPVSGG
jgi:molybdopterin converting factor small subunit